MHHLTNSPPDGVPDPSQALTLEMVCSDPAIREAFTDPETSLIFKEIEEDPRTLNKHKDNVKVQRSLGIIHDRLKDLIPPSGPLQQQLPLPSMMQMMTQMTSLKEPEESQDLMRQVLQSSKNGGQDHLQQLFQQICGGGSPPNLQIPTQNLSVDFPIPDGHPPSNLHMPLPQASPNIPLSGGSSNSPKYRGHSNIKMSRQETPMTLPKRGEHIPSCLPPKKRREKVTLSEDQHMSVLPPKKTL